MQGAGSRRWEAHWARTEEFGATLCLLVALARLTPFWAVSPSGKRRKTDPQPSQPRTGASGSAQSGFCGLNSHAPLLGC